MKGKGRRRKEGVKRGRIEGDGCKGRVQARDKEMYIVFVKHRE